MKRLAVIGNCQGHKISKIFEILLPNFEIEYHSIVQLRNVEASQDNLKLLSNFDHIFTIPFANAEMYGKLSSDELLARGKGITYPTLTFTGYHPDCIYLNSGKTKSPIGDYHSAMVAASFLLGFSVETAIALFNGPTFKQLGYQDKFKFEMNRFESVLAKFDLEFGFNVDDLFRTRKMMHTINHPRVQVLEALSKAMLRKAGIPFDDIEAHEFVTDNFPESTIFPVYPNIVDSIPGSFTFKGPVAGRPRASVFSLAEFVKASYAIYADLDEKVIANDSLPEIIENLRHANNSKSSSKARHPYLGLPDHCFWKRSFREDADTDVVPPKVDLVTQSEFRIAEGEKIATAGSCFAQHLAKRLSKSGYNYFVSEKPSEEMSEKESADGNFGVFSCRYGNIYTTHQLAQLFERAYGRFSGDCEFWRLPNGNYVDPYRPRIQKGGFKTQEAAIDDRDKHLFAVREMFEKLDYFVFTMGLTEGWRDKENGAVLPVAPGVAGGEFDESRFEFVNFDYGQVHQELTRFIKGLREVNPKSKMILTVSPVPLAATYEDRHVLVSTTVSKSILRAVADKVQRNEKDVYYFPSYEIITGNYTRSRYFEGDLREVRSEGVDHVMGLFEKYCTHPLTTRNATAAPSRGIQSEADALAEIVCEEDLLNL
ncbi:GSCFA domain-containing protein [Phaeobacter gallaeciensis]|uniref:GSCFA domain-containing protein n=1 Tax=Phaeobacter gallaeciensis TaxID=60890 RepID=UPI00237F2398|nr:GSCFA domain-containing protein [Phaeobacter gallaeciensis]MDE4142340.1 GSCFA domain-containing protein [Phaeobacter gallaeciensis]MDE4150689.1 GSCFA domain-containing protein [Phaeobacter gallaeciensis]MDE4154918.1 GSCFA domain-containing protein [Phaeobacter gallaeciensis]MDE4230404.1 GSCFA domain-containing protein [Phaeobacter gallaeciensis]MDE4259481.1 GSCFA domain-containing protein [Phaeobacter gallaeciensis]